MPTTIYVTQKIVSEIERLQALLGKVDDLTERPSKRRVVELSLKELAKKLETEKRRR